MHFGLPCKTWGPLARMNGSLRSRAHPEGFPPSLKDLVGNREARAVGSLCRSLSLMGALWSIENPQGSYCFLYAPIRDLSLLPEVSDVHFDQCMFGLRPPGTDVPADQRVRKSTTIRSNVAGFSQLARRCDRLHAHTWALGSTQIGSTRVSRAAAAGCYPPDLCQKMAALVWTPPRS